MNANDPIFVEQLAKRLVNDANGPSAWDNCNAKTQSMWKTRTRSAIELAQEAVLDGINKKIREAKERLASFEEVLDLIKNHCVGPKIEVGTNGLNFSMFNLKVSEIFKTDRVHVPFEPYGKIPRYTQDINPVYGIMDNFLQGSWATVLRDGAGAYSAMVGPQSNTDKWKGSTASIALLHAVLEKLKRDLVKTIAELEASKKDV